MSNANYPVMLFALARSANARRILEIGAGPEGGSGKTFASALPEGGELWSVDINTSHPPEEVRAATEAEFKITWRVLHGDSLTVPLDALGATETHDLPSFGSPFGRPASMPRVNRQ